MKKIFIFCLSILLALSYTSCNNNSIDTTGDTVTEAPIVERFEIGFENLSARDITSATVTLNPNNKTVRIGSVDELLSLLNSVEIYSEDSSYEPTPGEGAYSFTILKIDGRKLDITAYDSSYILVNGTFYKCNSEACEQLNSLAVKLQDVIQNTAEGTYIVTPASGQTIRIDEKYSEYIPYISEELISSAESKLTEKVSLYGYDALYYISPDKDGYLCLNKDIVKYYSQDEENNSAGCTDHEHISLSERITTKSIYDALNIDTEKIKTSHILAQYPFYQNAKSLFSSSDYVFEGVVTDITFDILDTRTGISVSDIKYPDCEYLKLYTVYEICVSEEYRGNMHQTYLVCLMGGLEHYEFELQCKMMKKAGIYDESVGVPLLSDAVKLDVGSSYLFFASEQYGAYKYAVNPTQFALSENDASGIEYSDAVEYATDKRFVIEINMAIMKAYCSFSGRDTVKELSAAEQLYIHNLQQLYTWTSGDHNAYDCIFDTGTGASCKKYYDTKTGTLYDKYENRYITLEPNDRLKLNQIVGAQ